jgi:C1A family cysteine protease
MKFILALLITASSLTKNTAEVHHDSGDPLDKAFNSWSSKYSKIYSSLEEKERRKKVWKENVANIAEINAAGLTWKAELNQFGDITNKEFREKILMPNENAIPSFGLKKGKHLRTTGVGQQYPESFDWRLSEMSVVTPVKDQGFVGTCWYVGIPVGLLILSPSHAHSLSFSLSQHIKHH